MSSVARRLGSTPHLRPIVTGVVAALVAVAGSVALVEWVSVDREPAVWAIDGEVGESSLVIPIRAAHASCPSWATLGGLVVEAVETETHVAIIATFPHHGDDTPCEWLGTAMSGKVKLSEPLGDRQVIDAATGADPATPVALAFHTGQVAGG